MNAIRSMTRLALVCVAMPLALHAVEPSSLPSINSEFLSVLRSGNSRALREALDHGAAVNARDNSGNTPLMLAAAYGDSACLHLLLDRGADVNASNSAGATALMRAAGDFDSVALLLDRGANVNARSGLGNTALILAARPWNSHRSVELLLGRGANAKATNNWGASALMAAAAGGDLASACLLIQHGAKANAQPAMDHEGFILGGARSPLMWAAFRGDLAMMKMLIEAGADVNSEGFVGTPLSQATWGGHPEAAKFLIERGARVNQANQGDGYTPLHWAASSEENDPSLVKLLLKYGANANLGGGEHVDAFMGTAQTPLMLARRRGDTAILAALLKAGATNEAPDRVRSLPPTSRTHSDRFEPDSLPAAIGQAVPLLQETAIASKRAFVNHATRQDCTSCHQQYLPMAAIGLAKKLHVPVDATAERELHQIVAAGELKNSEADWQALFHPDAVHTKGYTLFAYAAAGLPADANTDAWVHHLAAIQGKDGQWYNNLPRPPLQTSDVGATALAVQALQRYALPGRKAEFAKQLERARRWLWTVKPRNHEERIYQLLGLSWAGEPASKLQGLAKALVAEQRNDGGWAQLPKLKSDAYATGQAIYALRVGAGAQGSNPAVEGGQRYLLQTQLDDGSWHVRRRAFPFQPTMNSGFPHGRDSWISAAGTSWAVMALSLQENPRAIASK